MHLGGEKCIERGRNYKGKPSFHVYKFNAAAATSLQVWLKNEAKKSDHLFSTLLIVSSMQNEGKRLNLVFCYKVQKQLHTFLMIHTGKEKHNLLQKASGISVRPKPFLWESYWVQVSIPLVSSFDQVWFEFRSTWDLIGNKLGSSQDWLGIMSGSDWD